MEFEENTADAEVAACSAELLAERKSEQSVEDRWFLISGVLCVVSSAIVSCELLFNIGLFVSLRAACGDFTGWVIQLVTLFSLVACGVLACRQLSLKDKFRMRYWQAKYIRDAFVWWFVLISIALVVTWLFQEGVFQIFGYMLGPRNFLLWLMLCSKTTFCITVVSAVVFAPIVEELVFRVVIFECVKRYLGVVGSVLITSALFSAVHLTLIQSPALFIFGVGAQLMYIRSGSVFPSIIMHSLYNLVISGFVLVGRYYYLGDLPFMRPYFDSF